MTSHTLEFSHLKNDFQAEVMMLFPRNGLYDMVQTAVIFQANMG